MKLGWFLTDPVYPYRKQTQQKHLNVPKNFKKLTTLKTKMMSLFNRNYFMKILMLFEQNHGSFKM